VTYAEAKAVGLCGLCRKRRATIGVLCGSCSRKHNVAQNARYWVRKLNARYWVRKLKRLCDWCRGKTDGSVYCDGCRKRRAKIPSRSAAHRRAKGWS
jgi:hypothetical protein